jgi:hypothetical protein
MSTRVWALAVGGAGADDVRGQTRPPERVVGVEELRRGAFDAPPDWFWVVDRAVRPAPDALAALLTVSFEGLPAPVLLTSYVSSADPLAQPLPALDKELEVEAAAHGLVPVRAVATAGFLVRPGALPLGMVSAGRFFALTSLLLRESPGYLVPGSRASLDGRVAERLGARAATLRSAWRGPERIWFALRLLREALREG